MALDRCHFLKPLSKVQEKAEKKSSSKTKTLIPIIALAVMLGAFANFMSAEMLKGVDYTLVALVSMFSMMGIMLISNKPKLRFLKEWSLGIAIVCGLMVGYFV
ncbi:DUF5058 family protein [Bacillus sp. JCM 19041]|uniref:DUF5058 family protein n=1 Tax=Bacillus sp. JCM 19041 TaxID=1460637 RepID=UPI000A7A0A7F